MALSRRLFADSLATLVFAGVARGWRCTGLTDIALKASTVRLGQKWWSSLWLPGPVITRSGNFFCVASGIVLDHGNHFEHRRPMQVTCQKTSAHHACHAC